MNSVNPHVKPASDCILTAIQDCGEKMEKFRVKQPLKHLTPAQALEVKRIRQRLVTWARRARLRGDRRQSRKFWAALLRNPWKGPETALSTDLEVQLAHRARSCAFLHDQAN